MSRTKMSRLSREVDGTGRGFTRMSHDARMRDVKRMRMYDEWV